MADTVTENGAPSYSTTGDSRLDFFIRVGRTTSREVVWNMLEKSWEQSPLDTLRLVFHLRDCRGGKGERQKFFDSLSWLATNYPEHLLINIEHIPFYGRYKDYFVLMGTQLEGYMLRVFANILSDDLQILRTGGKSVTLAAKYAPSEGSKIDKQYGTVAKLCSILDMTKAQYRKDLVSPLRKHIDIVERHMTSERLEWETIDFSKVPSCALKKYARAFQKHQPDRYAEWLNSVRTGKTSMNVSRLMPHEIVGPYLQNRQYGVPDPTLEAQWMTYVSNIRKTCTVRNCLSVIDVSGSMYCSNVGSVQPITVAVSLGLLLAELTSGPFANRFFTFSSTPTLETITGETLCDKVKNIAAAHWGFSTDLYAVFSTLLSIALEKDVSPVDMPSTIFIFSDMQFDSACKYRTNWQLITDAYLESGYSVPQLVFWNLSGNKVDFPVQKDSTNTVCVSGFSVDILSMIIESGSVSPLDFMNQVLSSSRYQRIVVPEDRKCTIM